MSAIMLSVTKVLAEFLASLRYEDIPDEVKTRAKHHILDWIGVAVAGSSAKTSRIIADFIRRAGGKEEATLIGYREKAPCVNAAFANGFMGHVLELDDGDVPRSYVHPATCANPAALATAEVMGASGKDYITAIVAGYEAMIRIGASIKLKHYGKLGFHSTGTCGTFGAAVAAGKILDLNSEEMAYAIGLAACQAAGLTIGFGSDAKPFHAGKAAMNGVIAAMLAKEGITGPTTTLDGKGFDYAYTGGEPNSEAIIRDLGKDWMIMGCYMKRYPCAFQEIFTIVDLVKEHDIKPEDVDEVLVELRQSWLKGHGYYTDGSSVTSAKCSLPYCVAVAIMDRQVGLEQFTWQRIRDPKLLEFMRQKVKIIPSSLPDDAWEEKRFPWVTIKTKDGKTFRADYVPRKDFVGGDKWSKEMLQEKFVYLASRELPKEKVSKIIEIVNKLEEIADIRELTYLLVP